MFADSSHLGVLRPVTFIWLSTLSAFDARGPAASKLMTLPARDCVVWGDGFDYAARGSLCGPLACGAVTRFVDFVTAARMSYQ